MTRHLSGWREGKDEDEKARDQQQPCHDRDENPAAAACGEERQRYSDNRDNRQPVLDQRETQLAGAAPRTRLIAAARGPEDLHIGEQDDRDGPRHRRQGEDPIRDAPSTPRLIGACGSPVDCGHYRRVPDYRRTQTARIPVYTNNKPTTARKPAIRTAC